MRLLAAHPLDGVADLLVLEPAQDRRRTHGVFVTKQAANREPAVIGSQFVDDDRGVRRAGSTSATIVRRPDTAELFERASAEEVV
jgi:hypothetical protein